MFFSWNNIMKEEWAFFFAFLAIFLNYLKVLFLVYKINSVLVWNFLTFYGNVALFEQIQFSNVFWRFSLPFAFLFTNWRYLSCTVFLSSLVFFQMFFPIFSQFIISLAVICLLRHKKAQILSRFCKFNFSIFISLFFLFLFLYLSLPRTLTYRAVLQNVTKSGTWKTNKRTPAKSYRSNWCKSTIKRTRWLKKLPFTSNSVIRMWCDSWASSMTIKMCTSYWNCAHNVQWWNCISVVPLWPITSAAFIFIKSLKVFAIYMTIKSFIVI